MIRIKRFLFLLLLACTAVNAAELPREEAVPGGIAIITLGASVEGERPKAYYRGKQVMVVRHQGQWHAVVGLSLSAKPGRHTLRAHQTSGHNSEHVFTVSDKNDSQNSGLSSPCSCTQFNWHVSITSRI